MLLWIQFLLKLCECVWKDLLGAEDLGIKALPAGTAVMLVIECIAHGYTQFWDLHSITNCCPVDVIQSWSLGCCQGWWNPKLQGPDEIQNWAMKILEATKYCSCRPSWAWAWADGARTASHESSHGFLSPGVKVHAGDVPNDPWHHEYARLLKSVVGAPPVACNSWLGWHISLIRVSCTFLISVEISKFLSYHLSQSGSPRSSLMPSSALCSITSAILCWGDTTTWWARGGMSYGAFLAPSGG